MVRQVGGVASGMGHEVAHGAPCGNDATTPLAPIHPVDADRELKEREAGAFVGAFFGAAAGLFAFGGLIGIKALKHPGESLKPAYIAVAIGGVIGGIAGAFIKAPLADAHQAAPAVHGMVDRLPPAAQRDFLEIAQASAECAQALIGPGRAAQACARVDAVLGSAVAESINGMFDLQPAQRLVL